MTDYNNLVTIQELFTNIDDDFVANMYDKLSLYSGEISIGYDDDFATYNILSINYINRTSSIVFVCLDDCGNSFIFETNKKTDLDQFDEPENLNIRVKTEHYKRVSELLTKYSGYSWINEFIALEDKVSELSK